MVLKIHVKLIAAVHGLHFPGLHAYDSSEQLECLEDMEFSTDDNDLSDLFPIEGPF